MMDIKDETPLNPQQINTKNEPEPATYYPPNQSRSSKCLVYVLLTVVLLSIALLVLGLVFLRVQTPTLRLSAAAITGLSHGNSSLNTTVVAGAHLHNPNVGRFGFRGGHVSLMHESTTIGSARIGEGSIGGGESREMNVSIIVYYNINNNNNNSNFVSGIIRMRGLGEVRGEVRVLGTRRRPRSAVMDCTFGLNVTRQGIQDLLCN